MTTLQIGDPWPVEWGSYRGLVTHPIRPVWHALITPPQKEKATSDRLRGAGVTVRYPTWTNVRHAHGKKREYILPCVPSIIYARFTYAPQWDVMKARGLIIGLFARQGQPIALSEDDIARVMGLPTEAEKQERERLEALIPRVGEKAEVNVAGMALLVDVERVEAGRVWWSMVSGLKGEAAVEKMTRLPNAS
jgi:hypothetical protein